MPESRNRPGHVYQQPADIPASQRTKGRITWAILFAVFGGLIAYFVVSANWIVWVIAAVVAGVAGYFIGKRMEKDVKP